MGNAAVSFHVYCFINVIKQVTKGQGLSPLNLNCPHGLMFLALVPRGVEHLGISSFKTRL